MAQKLAINRNRRVIEVEQLVKDIGREARSELGIDKLIKSPIEVVNQSTIDFLNYLSSLEAHVDEFGCSNSKDAK